MVTLVAMSIRCWKSERFKKSGLSGNHVSRHHRGPCTRPPLGSTEGDAPSASAFASASKIAGREADAKATAEGLAETVLLLKRYVPFIRPVRVFAGLNT